MLHMLSSRGVFIWLICAAFFMYEFFLRTVIGTFQHPIMQQLDLTPLTFAFVSSTAYMFAYGLMQIPVGIFSAKFGIKTALSVACLLCVISAFGLSFSETLNQAVGFRFMMGLGSSFGFICLLIAVYEWLPRQYSGFFIGLSQFVGTVGPMLAAGPVQSVVSAHDFSWRALFELLAIVGVVLAVLVIAFVRNNTNYQDGFRVLAISEPVLSNVKRIYSQRQAWLIALYSACIYFSIEYLSEAEGKVYLELKGYEASFASYMISAAWLSYAISCPLIGFLSDYWQRRKTLMIATAISCVCALLMIVYLPHNMTSIVIAFVLLGFGASGQSLGFAIMAEQCRDQYLAAGLGLNNGMVTVVVAVNAPIMGGVLSWLSHGHPALFDYTIVMLVPLGLAIIAAFTVIVGIKETFCKSMREPYNLSY